MSSDDNDFTDDEVNGAPHRGSLSSSSSQVWRCPFCDHSLTYAAKNKDVAELAANSHVSRQHRREEMIVILPDADNQAVLRASGQESFRLQRGGDSSQEMGSRGDEHGKH